MKKLNRKKRALAISQIFILVLGIIAISYAIGSSVGIVSAELPEEIQEDDYPEGIDAGLGSDAYFGFGATGLGWLNIKGGKEPPPTTGNPAQKFDLPKLAPDQERNLDIALADTGSNLESLDEGIWGAIKSNAGQIFKNALTAAAIYGAIRMFGSIATSDAEAVDAVSKAVAISYFFTKSLKDVGVFQKLGATSGWWTFGVGAGIAIAIFLATYKKTEEQKIKYTCTLWNAPTGGENCDKCNNQGILPCTEYQCKSLGQSCEIINKGTDEELCVWQNRKDVNPPVIRPWEDILVDDFYEYNSDNAIAPPDTGVFIKYKNACIPAFTSFKFGIKIVGGGVDNKPEPAICKIDLDRKKNFEDMQYYFGESSTAKYNHSQIMSLPPPESSDNGSLVVQNNGEYELFVKCQDANGNENTANFVFKYCVDSGPDHTAPNIIGTNLNSGEPIAYDQGTLDLELYVNEPAECKWTYDKDKSYEQMEGNMQCSNNVLEINAQMVYTCTTTLQGIQNRQENKFYFKCKDQPQSPEADRNVNTEGYPFVVIGTQPLSLDFVGPNGTIKDSKDSVKVTLLAETSAGYDEGDAECYFSESCHKTSGSKTDFDHFYYEEGISSHSHSHDLHIPKGTYQCVIKCIDRGGNTDSKEFSYKIETDKTPPEVVRAYHEDAFLKIIINEAGKCVYSLNGCNYLFEPDGLPMSDYDGKEHFVDWDTDKTYYIKCEDEWGNQPYPNECNIIVRPFEFFEG